MARGARPLIARRPLSVPRPGAARAGCCSPRLKAPALDSADTPTCPYEVDDLRNPCLRQRPDLSVLEGNARRSFIGAMRMHIGLDSSCKARIAVSVVATIAHDARHNHKGRSGLHGGDPQPGGGSQPPRAESVGWLHPQDAGMAPGHATQPAPTGDHAAAVRP